VANRDLASSLVLIAFQVCASLSGSGYAGQLLPVPEGVSLTADGRSRVAEGGLHRLVDRIHDQPPLPWRIIPCKNSPLFSSPQLRAVMWSG